MTTVVFVGETNSGFIAPLQKQYTTYAVRSGKQGQAAAQQHQADVIVIDAVSLKSSGHRICKAFRRQLPECCIVHIYDNEYSISNGCATSTLHPPLSARALIKTIDHLLVGQAETTLRCAGFELDIQRSILIAHGEEIALRPKQAALIELFLRHPNETLDRKFLMQEVWDTDYTGDTRTLNVHIRHVRSALEVDASNPQYLKTVRGVGYCFEVLQNKKADH